MFTKITTGALAALAALTLTAAPATAAAGKAEAGRAATGKPETGRDDALRKELERLVKEHGFPGALGTVRDKNGRVRHVTAGVADLRTKAKIPADAYVRIASNTKTYTAVVALQLAGEGKIDLDAPVEKYLPKVIRGNGNDGRKITVRMLLNHTSGLPNYTQDMPSILEVRDKYREPYDLLRQGLGHKRLFPPGKDWAYSNTGYVALGLLIQEVTGRPIQEEITKRIIKPLGLKHTYWPGPGVQTIRDPHPAGYHFGESGAKPVDVTEIDPSWGWAAGQLIARPSDVNRFFVALMGGKLLKPQQLKEMKETVKLKNFLPGFEYGLGMFKIKLSCGGHIWGHGGDIDGYETRNGVTEEGRAVSFALTALPKPADEKAALAAFQSLDRVFCATG
ncbi:serine hydrolase domain-containing protein [Nonomuraea sp. CA-218870]|uniref:serine hydrolase domain-containing protein n=1 Tax=Nonomuraea sp. CA-218870 TaxID=3239998 RepID=UPI003D913ACF